jgi:hypothetical protein
VLNCASHFVAGADSALRLWRASWCRQEILAGKTHAMGQLIVLLKRIAIFDRPFLITKKSPIKALLRPY